MQQLMSVGSGCMYNTILRPVVNGASFSLLQNKLGGLTVTQELVSSSRLVPAITACISRLYLNIQQQVLMGTSLWFDSRNDEWSYFPLTKSYKSQKTKKKVPFTSSSTQLWPLTVLRDTRLSTSSSFIELAPIISILNTILQYKWAFLLWSQWTSSSQYEIATKWYLANLNIL